MNRQKFIDKFMAAFVLLAMFKIIGIVAQLFHESFWSVVGTLFLFLIVAFIIFMVIAALKDKEQNERNSGKEVVAVVTFISKTHCLIRSEVNMKNWHKNTLPRRIKKAAKVYMNLLQDNYRGAKTLEDGGFYNESCSGLS